MIFHYEGIIIGTPRLHSPIQESFQSCNISSIPFLHLVKIRRIYIGISIDAVKIQPLNRDSPSITVTNLSNSGISPIPLISRIFPTTVHEYINFNIFREHCFLHIKQFCKIRTFKVVVPGKINKNTPSIFNFCRTVRNMLGNNGIFTVLIFHRSINR